MSGNMAPYTHVLNITPADTDLDEAGSIRAVFIGGGGDLVVRMLNGDTGTEGNVVLTVVDGTLLEISPIQIRSSGGTATAIVALW